jgi:hypothetical protein
MLLGFQPSMVQDFAGPLKEFPEEKHRDSETRERALLLGTSARFAKNKTWQLNGQSQR